MASTLFKQTNSITITNVVSHVKRSRIPPKLMKRIERQQKICEQAFNHTVKLSDWKSEVKLKSNSLDEEYNIDDRSTHEAASYNSIIVGSPNYSQQYPLISSQNINYIYNLGQRRIPRKEWDIPYSISSEFGVPLFTPINFGDQMPSTKSIQKKKRSNNSSSKDSKSTKFQNDPNHSNDSNPKSSNLPFTLNSIECPSSLIHLKDGSDRHEMPFFINDDLGIEVCLYRVIPNNIKSHHRLQTVINHFDPNCIITECNAFDFKQFQSRSNSNPIRSAMHSVFQYLIPSVMNLHLKWKGSSSSDITSSVMNILRDNKKINVIAGGLSNEYQQLLTQYCFLADLFSLSAIEISPILPNKIIPKKIRTISTQLLKGNNRMTSEMRYMIYPYFLPHLHLLGQMTNSYLMHCLYGSVGILGSNRILMVISDDNAFDLITKMQSSKELGYYHKYSYRALFKEVNEEFVTMPTMLPSSYVRNSSVKLQEFEWKRLHSMFGLQFVKFLEHEMDMRQALVIR